MSQEKNLRFMTVIQLREECARSELPTNGSKAELIKRIKERLKKIAEEKAAEQAEKDEAERIKNEAAKLEAERLEEIIKLEEAKKEAEIEAKRIEMMKAEEVKKKDDEEIEMEVDSEAATPEEDDAITTDSQPEDVEDVEEMKNEEEKETKEEEKEEEEEEEVEEVDLPELSDEQIEEYLLDKNESRQELTCKLCLTKIPLKDEEALAAHLETDEHLCKFEQYKDNARGNHLVGVYVTCQSCDRQMAYENWEYHLDTERHNLNKLLKENDVQTIKAPYSLIQKQVDELNTLENPLVGVYWVNEVIEAKSLQTFKVTYSCLCCNLKDENRKSGDEIIEHIKTRNHILSAVQRHHKEAYQACLTTTQIFNQTRPANAKPRKLDDELMQYVTENNQEFFRRIRIKTRIILEDEYKKAILAKYGNDKPTHPLLRKFAKADLEPDQKAKIQDTMDRCKKPIAGLAYISERRYLSGDLEYFCVLCNEDLDRNDVPKHLMTVAHKKKFLARDYPDLYEKVLYEGRWIENLSPEESKAKQKRAENLVVELCGNNLDKFPRPQVQVCLRTGKAMPEYNKIMKQKKLEKDKRGAMKRKATAIQRRESGGGGGPPSKRGGGYMGGRGRGNRGTFRSGMRSGNWGGYNDDSGYGFRNQGYGDKGDGYGDGGMGGYNQGGNRNYGGQRGGMGYGGGQMGGYNEGGYRMGGYGGQGNQGGNRMGGYGGQGNQGGNRMGGYEGQGNQGGNRMGGYEGQGNQRGNRMGGYRGQGNQGGNRTGGYGGQGNGAGGYGGQEISNYGGGSGGMGSGGDEGDYMDEMEEAMVKRISLALAREMVGSRQQAGGGGRGTGMNQGARQYSGRGAGGASGSGMNRQGRGGGFW